MLRRLCMCVFIGLHRTRSLFLSFRFEKKNYRRNDVGVTEMFSILLLCLKMCLSILTMTFFLSIFFLYIYFWLFVALDRMN